MRRPFTCLAVATCLLITGGRVVWAQDARKFLISHCVDCHSGSAPDGNLDLERLGTDLSRPEIFAAWERVHDRVQRGEMPPSDADSTTAQERTLFTGKLARSLTSSHQAQKGTVLRRLNRSEYENTVNDLFGTNLDLASMFPEDTRSHEFDNVGEALGVSRVQMQRYLESAELTLRNAIASTLEPPQSATVRASYADTRGAEQWLNKVWLKRDDGAVVFFKQQGFPSGMLREATGSIDGWYNVRVRGYAFQSEKPVTFALSATTFARGAEKPHYGYFTFPPGDSTTIETRVWLPARYMIEITPFGIQDKNNEIRNSGVVGYEGPGLAIEYVEVEGPLVDEFPSRGHRLLFENLNRVEVPPKNAADRKRRGFKPEFRIEGETIDADVLRTLERVGTVLFRRPVTSKDIEPFLNLYRSEIASDVSVEGAVRTSIMAMMCSPKFLFLQENEGALDDHALASRLSYFLNRTTPDQELLLAAARGELTRDDEVLRDHVERLLADPKSSRFIHDFTDAWLNLREIEFTNPDGLLFPEFDPYLLHSSLEETRGYFRHLIDKNLGSRYLVKSDFAMINERLANHYGMQGVTGPECRPVPINDDSVRGGFMGQASVLKVSANGTNTSPVVRGVWVLERILGEKAPPPPPGVPGVEPDIRGATTLRELLAQHRDLDSCRGCHQLIDPPGFALEVFNPIGGFRDRYRSIGQGDPVSLEANGRKVRYKLGPEVDASGEFLSGESFESFLQFRDLLAKDDQRLAATLATKLATFATGRDMGFSDRAEIQQIVERTRSSEYGVKDLIRSVVTSPIFKHK